MFLYVILLTHGLELGNRRVSVVRTDNFVRTAKPTRKGKGTTFNSSLLSFLNQSIISIHIILILLDLIGRCSILGYTNIAYADSTFETGSSTQTPADPLTTTRKSNRQFVNFDTSPL